MRRFWFPSFLLVLWLLLAWRSPDVTYHLAPLLVAGAFAAVIGGGRGALVAFAATTAVAALAGAGGLLAGPSLLPVGGAVLEALVFAAVGSALGSILGRSDRLVSP